MCRHNDQRLVHAVSAQDRVTNVVDGGVGGRILYLHVVEAGGDLLTLRSRGLGLAPLRSLLAQGEVRFTAVAVIHNVVDTQGGVGEFGWRRER